MTDFTEKQVEQMVAEYVGAVENGADYDARTAVVQGLADELGFTVPQVRGKLVAEKVYVPKAKAKGGTDATKHELVSFIRIMLGAPDGTLETFEKATKADLEVARECLTRLSDQRDVEAQA